MESDDIVLHLRNLGFKVQSDLKTVDQTLGTAMQKATTAFSAFALTVAKFQKLPERNWRQRCIRKWIKRRGCLPSGAGPN